MTAENLIQAVKEYYKTQTHLTGKFSIQLSIETCYTELSLVSQKEQEEKEKKHLGEKKENNENKDDFQDRRIPSYEQLHVTKEKLEFPQIFDKAETHKVVVLGRAGIGKSTLCHRLAYEWAQDRLWENQFDLVIWVPLRNIAQYLAHEDSIFHIIQKECLKPDNYGEPLFEASYIKKALIENPHLKVLYLLDGFDEVSTLIRTDSHQARLLRKLFALPNLLLTSRPYSLDSFLGTLGNFKIDKTLENMGFSSEHSKQFIDRFFAEIQSSPDKAIALKRHIETNPNIRGIAHIPVVLLLICKFWQNCSGDENSLPTNMTELYAAITDNLCDQYIEAVLRRTRDSLKVGEKESLCRPLLLCLGRLAFKQMQETDLIISSEKIKNVISTTAPDLIFKDFVDFGLLTPTHENAKTKPAVDEKDYYFVHLTFQEFFAAWHIAERIKARDRSIYYFIRDNKYNPIYEIVWWFLAGLLKDSIESLEIFFGILESSPKDTGQLYHQILILRCMGECRLQVSIERKTRFLENLIGLIDFTLGINESKHYLAISSPQRKKFFQTTIKQYLTLYPMLFNEPIIVNRLITLLTKNDNYIISISEEVISLCESLPTLPPVLCSAITDILPQISTGMRGLSGLIEKHPSLLTQEVVHFVLTDKPKTVFEQPLITRSLLGLSYASLPQKFVEEMTAGLERTDLLGPMESIRFFTCLQTEVPDTIVIAIARLLCKQGDSYSTAAFFRKRSVIVSDALVKTITAHFRIPLVAENAETFLRKYRTAASLRMVILLLELFNDEERSEAQKALTKKLIGNGPQVPPLSPLSIYPMPGIMHNHDKFYKREHETREAKAFLAFVENNFPSSPGKIEEGAALLLHTPWIFIRTTAIEFFTKRQKPPHPRIIKIIAALLLDANKEVSENARGFFDKFPETLTDELAAPVVEFLSLPPRPLPWHHYADWSAYSSRLIAAIKFMQQKPRYLTKESLARITELFFTSGSASAAFEFFSAHPNLIENLDAIKALLHESDTSSINKAIQFFKQQPQFLSDDVVTAVSSTLNHESTAVAALLFFECHPNLLSRAVGLHVRGLFDSDSEYLRNTVSQFFERESKYAGCIASLHAEKYKFWPTNPVYPDERRRVAIIAWVNFFLMRVGTSEKDIYNDIDYFLHSDDPALIEGAICFISTKISILPENILTFMTELLDHPHGVIKQAALHFFTTRSHCPAPAIVDKIAKLTLYSDQTVKQDNEEVSDTALSFFATHPRAITRAMMKTMASFLWKHNWRKKRIAMNFFTNCSHVPPRIIRRMIAILLNAKYLFILHEGLSFIKKNPAYLTEEVTSYLIALLDEPDDKAREMAFDLLLEHQPTALLLEIMRFFKNFVQEKKFHFSEYIVRVPEREQTYGTGELSKWDLNNATLFLTSQRKLLPAVFQTLGELLYECHSPAHPTYLMLEEDQLSQTIHDENQAKGYIHKMVEIIEKRSLFEIIEGINERDKTTSVIPFAYLLAYKLSSLKIAISRNHNVITLGNGSNIILDDETQSTGFVSTFHAVFIDLTGFQCNSSSENFFERLDRSMLCDRTIEKPQFLLEQEALCRNVALQEKFRAIGEHVRRLGSPTLFLSHAWQLSLADDLRLGLHEQWADYCVKQLAIHLRLLGFTPILDFEALGTGVHLPTAMRTGVMTADHILIICTDTYFYKLEKTVLSGVGRELDLIKSRINPPTGIGVAKAHETRLLHGFLLTNKKPAGFSLIEGYDGFAGLWLRQIGYVTALLELVDKIFEHKIKTDHVLDSLYSPTQTLKREGFFADDEEAPTSGKTFSNDQPKGLIPN